jgi:thiol-disulfide isomerase/thioredoxin
MKKLAFLIALVALIAACNPYGSQVPENLVGAWINEQNGSWEYGFYEEFAICENDFWLYQSVDGDQIVLRNKGARPGSDGKETIALKINILNDSTITVNGNRYFKIDYSDCDNDLNYIEARDCAAKFVHKMSYFTDVKEDTTDFAPYRYLRNDSATIIYYDRNTAQGLSSLMRRYEFHKIVRYTDICRLNNMGFAGYGASPVDTSEHYGERLVYRVPTANVSEIHDGNLLQNWGSHIYLPVLIEDDDTLTCYMSRETLDEVPFINEYYIMGSNERYMRERTLFYNYLVAKGVTEYNNHSIGEFVADNQAQIYDNRHEQYVADTTLLSEFVAQSKMPISKKFVHYNQNALLYRFAGDVVWLEDADDFYKQNPQLFDEQEIMLSRWGFSFIMDYIIRQDSRQHTGDKFFGTIMSMQADRDNCEKYPDYILCNRYEPHFNILVDPKIVKDLGFGDEFLELLRYEYFDRYGYYVRSTDDNNRLSWKLLMGYEKQHFVNTIKKEKYRKEMDYVFANSGDCKISEFLKEHRGKVVVAYFWSERFSYNDDMMELMRQLQSDYASKGVVLVSIVEKTYSTQKISKEFEESIPGHHHFLSSQECNVIIGLPLLGNAAIMDKDGSMLLYMPFVSKEMADYFRKELDEVLKK